MIDKRIIIISREKPAFHSFFIYDDESSIEMNLMEFNTAKSKWAIACKKWREENIAALPRPESPPSPVDTYEKEGGSPTKKWLLVRRVGVFLLALTFIFLINYAGN